MRATKILCSAIERLLFLTGSDSLFYGREKHHESYPDHHQVKQDNHAAFSFLCELHAVS
jgi:hypothetical protein